jgi:hypothetical protein
MMRDVSKLAARGFGNDDVCECGSKSQLSTSVILACAYALFDAIAYAVETVSMLR